MAKQRWTYFNSEYKFRKVDEFCAWYANGNAAKVRTTKQVKRLLTDEEKTEIIRNNPHLRREESNYSSYAPMFGISPMAGVGDHITETVDDERFKDLREYVHRWVGIVKTDGDTQELLVEKLWPLIAQLTEEKRIAEGDGFRLENYGESDSAHLTGRMNNLERRVGNIENNPILKKGIGR